MFRRYLYKSSPYLVGVAASVGLLAFYLGLMTLTGDWFYAKIQFEQYRWWIIALSIGLGIQSTLFTFLRRGLKGTEKKAAKSTLAVTGSISTGSMVVCCLHHLTDIAPFLGLPILAVALQKYQTVFFLIGVLSNSYGILMMLRMMRKHGLIQTKNFSKFLILKLRVISDKGGYKDEKVV